MIQSIAKNIRLFAQHNHSVAHDPVSISCTDTYTSLLEAIRTHDKVLFYDYFENAAEELRKEVVLKLYDTIVDEIDGAVFPSDADDTRQHDRVLFLMTCIEHYFPDIKEYLFFRESAAERSGDRELVATKKLTTLGVRYIVEYLRDKGALTMSCDVYDDYESFEKMLSDLSGKNCRYIRKVCIVRAQSNANRSCISHHFFPLFVEKNRSGEVTFFISDSSPDLPKMISLWKRIVYVLPHSRVYMSSCQRQFDTSSCAVFSLRDVVYMARYRDMIRTIKQGCSHEDGEVDKELVLLDVLPLECMKTTQSMSTIARVLRSSPHPDRIIHNKKGVYETLALNIGRNLVMNTSEHWSNLLVQRRFHKYLRLIIKGVLE